jgi:hypothetical protein
MAMESLRDDNTSGRSFVAVTARRIGARQPPALVVAGLRLVHAANLRAPATVRRWARFAQRIVLKHGSAASSLLAGRAFPPAFARLPLPLALASLAGAPEVRPAAGRPSDLIGAPARPEWILPDLPVVTPPVAGSQARALRPGEASARGMMASIRSAPARGDAASTALHATIFDRDDERAGKLASSDGMRRPRSHGSGYRTGDQIRAAQQDAMRTETTPDLAGTTPTSPADESQHALARMERSSPLVLDRSVRDLLERLLRRQLPSVPIYANDAADTLARAAGADALAFSNRVVFRHGAYDPHSATGLALLGHELTHVAAMRAQPAAQAPSAGECAAEEREALDNERELLRFLGDAGGSAPEPPAPSGLRRRFQRSQAPGYSPVAMPPPAARGVVAVGQPSPMPPVIPPPRAASTGRDLGPAPTPPALALSDAELRRIKDEIYNDLLHRIRIDFERGA